MGTVDSQDIYLLLDSSFCSFHDTEKNTYQHIHIPTEVTKTDQLGNVLKYAVAFSGEFDAPNKSVCLGINQKYWTLVPADLYDPEIGSAYFNHLTKLPEQFKTYAHRIPSIDAYCVYMVEETITNISSKKFSNTSIYPVAASMIEMLVNENPAKTIIHLNVRGESLLIFFLKNGKLQFANQYLYKDINDALYYVMMIYDLFGLSPKETPLHLTGLLEKESALYNLLYKYIQEVKFFNPNQIDASKISSNESTAQYADLHSLKALQ